MTVFVAPLQSFGRDDVAQVGGKGANLGELLRAGLAVPPGFALTGCGVSRSARRGRRAG